MRKLVPIALLATACAGESGSDGDPFRCDLIIEVETADPRVGSPIFVRVFDEQLNFFTPDWSVRFNGSDVSFATEAGDSRRISFVPSQPGPYEVIADGEAEGRSCTSARETINAILPNAAMMDLRLRLTPPADSGEAPSEQTVRIFGGADYVLGEINLDQPFAVGGIVSDGGSPIEAYIKVTTAAGVPLAEAYSDATGAYALTLPDEDVEVTVLPADSNIAPLRMSAVSPVTLGDIDVGGADTVTGQVLSNGAPLANARVVLTVDGLPSSVALTAGDGSYSLRARTGGTAVLEVVPPASTGLPIAELELTDDPAAGSVIDVDYAAQTVSSVSSHDVTVTEADGSTPAPDARVLFAVDDLAGVAAVDVDGAAQNAATGRVRRLVAADGSGDINNLMLVDAVYTVVAEPGAGNPGRASLATSDSSGSLVARLAGAGVTWTANLRDGSEAVDGARLVARPSGLVAALATSSVTASSVASGDVSVELIAGADYQLQIDPPAGLAREHIGAITAPGSGTTDAGTISLVDSITVSGQVRAVGGSGEGSVHVAFYCLDCPTPEIPLAESITTGTGRFSVELPDPGLNP